MIEFSSRAATLPAIVTAARAGALDHAWALFEAAGMDTRTDDASALAVKGRLLKDRALATPIERRAAMFAEAAHAYAQADARLSQPYTRINVATLTLLAGDAERATALATGLLDWMDATPDIAETPYYLAATRAEAELLRGDRQAAEQWLDAAIACDRDGWADHASTLRQFGLILSARGSESAWLDRFRPPRSMHYAGHLGVAPDDHRVLTDAVAAEIGRAGIGFGFGALAAGSDIVIAEALIAAGAELHVVLPTAVETFAAQSVAPYGAGWTDRFEACLAAATDVRTTSGVTGAYEPLATGLAADIAMGAAVLNARRLESSAMQLLVVDDGPGRYGEGQGTARDGGRWAQSRRPQSVIVAPRTAPVTASARSEREGRTDRRLAAMLHIAFDGIDGLDDGAFAEALDTVIEPLRDQLASEAMAADMTLPAGNARIVAFTTPEAAWTYAASLISASPPDFPLRIAAHYALAHWLTDPVALVGRGVTDLVRIADGALPGTITASASFATAVMIAPADPPRAEPVGEVGTMTLYALSANFQ